MDRIIILFFLFSVFSCQTEKSKSGSVKETTDDPVSGAWGYQMVNTDSTDDPDKEWCYGTKSTSVIGVPFMPKSVQVTFDGAIYTGQAELCFFYGDSLRPLMARQKTFYHGWIPIVEYSWNSKGLDYHIEMFGATLKEEGPENSIQFVRVDIFNPGQESRKAVFASASRSSGGDHRLGKPVFHDDFSYAFRQNNFLRNEKIIYSVVRGNATLKAVPGIPYHQSFNAAEFGVTKASVVGICRYEHILQPGEKMELTFKMPRVPLSLDDRTVFLNKYQEALYDVYRQHTISMWEELIEGHGYFEIPEKRVNNAYKAGLVHLILATRTSDGKRRQGSGLPYDGLFFNDFVDMRLAYDVAGLPDFVELNVPWLLNSINEEGLFVDANLSHGKQIMSSHGQALYSLANHYFFTNDRSYGEKVYPVVLKAVGLIKNDHETFSNGLIRPSVPFDAEMIKGCYTSHNLWCLLGLRSAIRLARALGKEKDAKDWLQLHQSFERAVLSAIDRSAFQDGYVPTGLYDFELGKEYFNGFKDFRFNQDWENMLLIYPTEVLEEGDTRISGTLQHIRTNKYREGIMTYRNGMHLHQYATANMANQYIAINDQKHALLDLYHILLHNGSTHEGFENYIEPWSNRDAWPIPPPHAWAAAKTALLIRNMLVREYGGKAGLDENARDLYLFSVISPVWAEEGKMLAIHRIRTEFGEINGEMKFSDHGATIDLSPVFVRLPHQVVMPVPYFKEIINVESDAKYFRLIDGKMKFSPDVRHIQIEWKDVKQVHKENYQQILKSYREEPGVRWVGGTKNGMDVSAVEKMDAGAELIVIAPHKGFLLDDEKDFPDAPLSFDLVRKAYLKEYNKRYKEYAQAGKITYRPEPPSLWSK